MYEKQLSREEMIDKLVKSDLEDMSAEKSLKFLKRILRNGWKGYNEMSDAELKVTYLHRDLGKTD